MPGSPSSWVVLATYETCITVSLPQGYKGPKLQFTLIWFDLLL